MILPRNWTDRYGRDGKNEGQEDCKPNNSKDIYAHYFVSSLKWELKVPREFDPSMMRSPRLRDGIEGENVCLLPNRFWRFLLWFLVGTAGMIFQRKNTSNPANSKIVSTV